MRNIAHKTDGVGDTLTAGDFNSFNEELENVVISTDQTLDVAGGPDTPGGLDQLGKAVAAYANAGATYQDSGSANSYVLSIASNLKSVNKYYSGMTVTFKAGASNTGSSTVNVNSLGLKDITDSSGVALIESDILINKHVILIYNLSSDRFELLSYKERTEILTNKTIAGDDNTITEVDSIRDQGSIATSGLKVKLLDIGTWNMDTTPDKTIPHGLSIGNIIFVGAMVWNDAQNEKHDLISSRETNISEGGIKSTSTDILVHRNAGGFYDSTGFDSTAFSRGTIIVYYKG